MKSTFSLPRNFFLVCLALLLTLHGISLAQDDQFEFTLEEIVVTSEKRAENIQKIASSVFVMESAALMELGKTTTEQILEDVPNVRWSEIDSFTGAGIASPDSGISIRGVQNKQTSDGQPPAATATYVDGVFQGIGGNFDIERVEILRGPQGTLYGRSATGGVVAFHNRDPKLSEFDGFVSGEIGEANLMNFQGAINVPLGNQFAMRTAAHIRERDGYFNEDGNWSATREGRIKLLFQPSEKLRAVLTGTMNAVQSNSGGNTTYLANPETIDYDSHTTDVVKASSWARTTQGALNIDYDLGNSVLTYIGGYREYVDDENPGSVGLQAQWVSKSVLVNPGETFHTEELRWASDTEGKFKWLIGGSYYHSEYDRVMTGIHLSSLQFPGGPPDDTGFDTDNVLVFSMGLRGHVKNYGLFTEETFEVRDDFRITAGLRYDNTEVRGANDFDYNMNVNIYGNAYNPVNIKTFSYDETLKWDNVTYKVRLEYDLTPDNMLYALTATGFQPGDVRITSESVFDNGSNAAPTDVKFRVLPYDEEKLISYEVGSKNRFLDNTVQLNLSAFYYDYTGYRHTINTTTFGPPSYAVTTTPLRMYGVEVDGIWLVTPQDRLSFNAAMLDAKITNYPDIEGFGSSKQYLELEDLPDNPELTADISYDHTFHLTNGSILTPRVTLRYTDGHYVSQLTENHLRLGQKPYAWQDAYVLGDICLTWTSPNDKYGISTYVRNVTDKEYKADVTISNQNINSNIVTVGSPRAWGLNVNVRF